MDHFDYVILGGGVAGLCAAKRLLELDIHPLVIEAGSYPAHKVCGEFISPSSIPILNQWGIHPIPIYDMQWHTPSKHLQFAFRQPAGALSHLSLDLQLANQISQDGATLLTQTKVIDFSPAPHQEGSHILSLSSGKKIKAKHLLIATGRLPGYSEAPIPRYVGIKAHFSGLTLNSTLHMFSFNGAYLGIAPIENDLANLACLATMEHVLQYSSVHHFMQSLIASHPHLRDLLGPGINLFDGWMETFVPQFGLRSNPEWPHTYWIGDAAGTIPPASGNGLSLAIASGYLAAECAAKNQPLSFKREWKKRCATKIKIAKILHRIFLSPGWGSQAISLSHFLPSIPEKIFALTRDHGVIH